ncbi:hypothetical protein M9H77_07504 [Catharanthus roseus]|uniref:Uncharacterized protein n=1 Tax=Catharanthus roseus TaxID=4058 RepID=A0ACC0BVB6_CATRO|nr:hypothetical protein M9H77_07504 [Catharanthus roseus]
MHNTGCDLTKKRAFRYPVILSRIFAACHVNFAGERRLSTGAQQNQVLIPPSKEDRMRDRNLAGFRSIQKTTQTGLGASSSPITPQMMRRTRLVPRRRS